MEVHVRYMLNPSYFNKTAARRYVDSCRALPGIDVTENSLALDPDDVLTPDIYRELEPRGYSREELLAVTHTYIARKRGTGEAACAS